MGAVVVSTSRQRVGVNATGRSTFQAEAQQAKGAFRLRKTGRLPTTSCWSPPQVRFFLGAEEDVIYFLICYLGLFLQLFFSSFSNFYIPQFEESYSFHFYALYYLFGDRWDLVSHFRFVSSQLGFTISPDRGATYYDYYNVNGP